MRIYRNLAFRLLAMSAICLLPCVTQAGIVPSGSALSDLLPDGMYMEIDGFVFKGFRINPNPPTAYQPHPSEIIVSTFHDTVNNKIGLDFNIQGPNATLRGGEAYDIALDFDVHAPDDVLFNQQILSSTGFVQGSGEIAILEVVESVPENPSDDPVGLANLANVYFDDAFKSTDVEDFSTPYGWIHIRKDINVYGGEEQDDQSSGEFEFASLTDFRQTIMYTGDRPDIPEPTSIAIMLIGLSSMIMRRNTK